MFHVSIVRKDNKYYVRLVNSVVSTTGIKTSATLDESKVHSSDINMVVDNGNDLINALINAGMNVEPALGLSEE